jgi:tRNA(Ile2) C34 agmatinyltransferase TiaS
MDARQEEPPIDLDFEPVEEVDGGTLVEQQSELIELLYDGYSPHVYDWHEDVHERQREVWREIRERAESEEPECPECGAQQWAQSPGDPAYCRECGHEARAPRENAIHKAWDAIKKEVREA